MKRPPASDDGRERALAVIDEGQSVADVATFSQHDPSTIRRWMRQRVQTGTSRARPRSGRPRRIGPADEAALRAQVHAYPDATLGATTHGVRVGVSTMGGALRRLGMTLQKRP